nr:hypothetical protein Iba_chr06dCG8000 [Ipomoea batatas]
MAEKKGTSGNEPASLAVTRDASGAWSGSQGDDEWGADGSFVEPNGRAPSQRMRRSVRSVGCSQRSG